MGWVEIRLQQYNEGERATWLERRAIEHSNPVNFAFHVIGAIPIICGLWIHSWGLIAAGVLLDLVGHLYCWFKEAE